MNIGDTARVSRRALLGAGLASVLAATVSSPAAAQQKSPQQMVQYQQKPKGTQTCDTCLHFEPPESCKLVAGKINPKGWCALFALKPK
jgi:hypothetical protein